jgi:hypothetical protein
MMKSTAPANSSFLLSDPAVGIEPRPLFFVRPLSEVDLDIDHSFRPMQFADARYADLETRGGGDAVDRLDMML